MDATDPVHKTSFYHSTGWKWLVLLSVGIAWGGTAPLSKLAVSGGHHPIGIAFWGAAIGALLFSLALAAKRQRPRFAPRHVMFFVICGMLGTVIPDIASYEGYRHLPVGIIVLCYAGIPILTLALSAALRMEALNRTRVIGILLGAVAMILIALPDTEAPLGSWFWIALPLLAAVSYAGENVYIAARRPSGLGSLEVMVGLTVAAAILFAPMVFLFDAAVDLTVLGPSEQAIIGVAVLHVFAYFGFVWLIGQAGSVFAAQLSYVVTGSGILFGMLLYDETYGPTIWLALALMITGLTLVKPKE